MQLNMGIIDRIIRIILGIGLITGAIIVYFIPNILILSIILGITGLIMLGFCPLYIPLIPVLK